MDGNGTKRTKGEVYGEMLERKHEKQGKGERDWVGLRQMRTKDRWGRKQSIIRIKQKGKMAN